MKPLRVVGLLAVLAVVGALLVAGLWAWMRTREGGLSRMIVESVERAEELELLGDAEGLGRWIVAHPDQVALVTFAVGPDGEPLDDRPQVWHRPDAVHPIASLGKVGVAAAWTLAVKDGGRDAEAPVDVSTWDARWLPGTDGGAHDKALADLRREPWQPGNVPESRLVGAMIRHSDNAATDWVVDALGREALADVEARGLGHATSVHDLTGAFLLWSEVPAEELLAWDDAREGAARTARAKAWREAYAGVARKGPDLPDLYDQVRLAARFGPKGTAGDYARAMAGVVAGTWPSPSAAPSLDKALSWPMLSEASKARFLRFGAKGGALPGVIAEAFYVQPKEHAQARVVVLLIEGLPAVGWAAMLQSFVHQDFMLSLVEDEAKIRALAEALAR